jgi:hypothetical protein
VKDLRDASRLGAAAAALLCVALAPGRAAALHLLDRELSLDGGARSALGVVLAAAAPAEGPSLDFDLLGDAPKVQPVDDSSARLRRKMLNLHQGVGIGLFGLQVGTTVMGQLNYNDKFGLDNTGKYKQPHQIIAYTNLAAFALAGSIALFAPSAKGPKREGGVDRVTIHKIGMAVATAGMLAQAALGIYTASREGYLDKQDYGKAHLIVGYGTLAAMSVAVGALVF